MQNNKKHGNLLLWIVITVLIVLCLALFLWQNFSTSSSKTKPTPVPATIASTQKTPTKHPEPASAPQTPHTLVNDDINQQPIPQNSALTQEEIDKLNDIQKQLKAQQHTLQAQHQDADKLIQLKEEQIKLLEKQLAEQK